MAIPAAFQVMKLFRSELSPHQTALAMIGVKPGASVVVIGAGNPALVAELARVTGLNGRTLVVDSEHARDAVLAAAAKAGALVDFLPMSTTTVPVDDDAADVVVVQHGFGVRALAEQAIVSDAVRLVRTGGRMVAIEGERRRARLFGSTPPPRVSGDAIVSRFSAAGLIAARVLAESEGLVYVEARKK